MPVTHKRVKSATRATHGVTSMHPLTLFAMPSRTTDAGFSKLRGIVQLGSGIRRYEYDDKYVFDFSQMNDEGLAALNLFGIKLPSLTLPNVNQLAQTASQLYNGFKSNTSTLINTAVKTTSQSMSAGAKLINAGVNTLQAGATQAVNTLTSQANAIKTSAQATAADFNNKYLKPALQLALTLPSQAKSVVIQKVSDAQKGINETVQKIQKGADAVVQNFNNGINTVGKTAVNIVKPVIKAASAAYDGVTADMVAKVQQAASDLNTIEQLLASLSKRNDTVTKNALTTFNSLYGAVVDKARKNLGMAKKESGLSAVPILIAVPIILGISWILHEAVVYLQKLAEAPANQTQAKANELTANANLIDASTKSSAIETGSGAVMQANKELANKQAAAQTAAAAVNAKNVELSQDQALLSQITDAFNQKQAQIDQLNSQLQTMQAQGINPNDPNFQAVVNALNQANGDLANLHAQKQAADAEYAKDKQELAQLQQFAQAAAQAAAQAQADAAAANQNFNALVSGANLPSSGYSPTIPQGSSAPSSSDIFSSLTSSPLALLAVGGLAFVVLSGRRGN